MTPTRRLAAIRCAMERSDLCLALRIPRVIVVKHANPSHALGLLRGCGAWQ